MPYYKITIATTTFAYSILYRIYRYSGWFALLIGDADYIISYPQLDEAIKNVEEFKKMDRYNKKGIPRHPQYYPDID